jgi:hypothetical protein
MLSSTKARGSDLSLDRHVRQWVHADLISEQQAQAIERYERSASDSADGVAEPERLGLAAEVAAYLGSVLAVMGGTMVVGPRWQDISLAGRLAIAVAIAAVGFTAGSWLVRIGEAGTKRLGSLLWVVGAAGVALGVGVVVHDAGVDAGVAACSVGVAITAIGLGLWRNLDRPLQLLTTAVGIGTVTGGLIEVANLPPWRVGIAVWLLSAALFGAGARGALHPRLFVLMTGAAGAMLAAAMLGDLDEHLGPAVAAATAASVVVFALWDDSLPILVVGVIGFLIAIQALLATTFTGAASSGVVTLVGLAVVVVALARARTSPAERDQLN